MRYVSHAIALALAAVTTVSAASPVEAQRGFAPARELRRDIDRIENRIDQASRRGSISRQESVSLRRAAVQLDAQFSRASRNGLTRAEIAQLRRGVDRLEARIRAERRDRDRRRG